MAEIKHPASKGVYSATISIIVNLLLAIIKGIAGVLGNSYALVADAIESLSDVASSAIILIGLKISIREPDYNHPYGHGKAEPVAAIMVSIFLFVAAILIVIQSIRHILVPHDIPSVFTI
jgi:cation diffusion facilitator family transporter